ncbi:DUF4249 domain-containing protein [Aureibaculum sp. 2210JD6-5]|uniref:DUF4249 domain-containing protein n=1 Tax=Aureibaculum sp. 2210JD6-5 TaxID=3103957 RepID=UPI002AACF4D1|nr:DUF4249 domain-containing protein [Aureibaculum sp. 2210JD6-5]MDY7393751.1 DUF4249 domain-containing protein [Aureibaculum sp. 2210JD6-5]
MKRLLIFIILIGFISCEDVIDIDLPQSEPKLIIDASINWLKGTSGNNQLIKLSLSAPFFDDEVPPANGAQVKITNSENAEFIFAEDGDTGIYINSNFDPVINETYQLTVIYNNETYIGVETLKSVSPIIRVEQSKSGGFLGEDYEIKAYTQDPIDEDNYYLLEFSNDIPTLPTLEVFKDEFVNGNEVFAYFSDEDLDIGNEIKIRTYGTSERFYEFMFILLQQTSEGGGGPFETQPATVRGNCVNTTNKENFPLGYFRLSEVDEFVYVIQ